MKASMIEISFSDESMQMLKVCASWRGMSVQDLARAYVEDWVDVDYPESQGRQTRRGIHRDGPITLDELTRQQTSQNWRDELGAKRI